MIHILYCRRSTTAIFQLNHDIFRYLRMLFLCALKSKSNNVDSFAFRHPHQGVARYMCCYASLVLGFFFLPLFLWARNTWPPFKEGVGRCSPRPSSCRLHRLAVFSGLLPTCAKRSNNYTFRGKTALITVCVNKVHPNLLETESDVLNLGVVIEVQLSFVAGGCVVDVIPPRWENKFSNPKFPGQLICDLAVFLQFFLNCLTLMLFGRSDTYFIFRRCGYSQSASSIEAQSPSLAPNKKLCVLQHDIRKSPLGSDSKSPACRLRPPPRYSLLLLRSRPNHLSLPYYSGPPFWS